MCVCVHEMLMCISLRVMHPGILMVHGLIHTKLTRRPACTHIHTHTYKGICLYMYACAHVCVCVFVVPNSCRGAPLTRKEKTQHRRQQQRQEKRIRKAKTTVCFRLFSFVFQNRRRTDAPNKSTRKMHRQTQNPHAVHASGQILR